MVFKRFYSGLFKMPPGGIEKVKAQVKEAADDHAERVEREPSDETGA